MLRTWNYSKREKGRKKPPTSGDEKLHRDGMRILGKRVLTLVKMKNWATTGKEGERGNAEERGREALALPVKISAPDFKARVTLLVMLSSQESRKGQDDHTQTRPSGHSTESVVSWSSVMREGAWAGDAANSAGWAEEICVENTKNGPLLILGGKNIQNPLETKTKQKQPSPS